MARRRSGWLTLALLALAGAVGADGPPAGPVGVRPFGIQVLDRATRRPVPLVELTTTGGVTFVTDNGGWAAIDEPEWSGERVWFTVTSHGYAFPKDGFGFAGTQVEIVPGRRATLEIDRVHVAERLYRITGEGRWRETRRLGEAVPERVPGLRGGVVGQDSTQAEVYRGRVFWLWGDTNRLAYPLGLFHAAGATSPLPGAGGLDPDRGVDLEYWVGEDGFARALCPNPGPGPVWIDGLCVLADEQGRERLVGTMARMRDLGTVLERGLVVFDDESATFEKVLDVPLDAPLYPSGHSLRVVDEQGEWLVFGNPFPTVRVRARWADVMDLSAYEGFSCVPPGTRALARETRPERDAQGRARWGWKRGTLPMDAGLQAKLTGTKALALDQAPYLLIDAETGEGVVPHAGSLRWNPFRRRWIAVFGQAGGTTSFLGELWFAEADGPTGPWAFARRVVTHDKMTCYNPVHHAFFDSDGGRVIRFEGTYCTTFSNAPARTPRYDYNQILYRLDLADPRLDLPVAWYVRADDAAAAPTTADALAPEARARLGAIAWFGLRAADGGPPPPARRRPAPHAVDTLDRGAHAPRR